MQWLDRIVKKTAVWVCTWHHKPSALSRVHSSVRMKKAAQRTLSGLCFAPRPCRGLGVCLGLQTRSRFQRGGTVGAFPSEVGLVAAKVAVGGGLAVDGAQQIQHLDDAFGAQVKVLGHEG